ncbi:MAG: ATP-binding protein [Bdellovibrionales bacterium]|nr:ATP-binding protein [Bdellovibrionales bacterium]
MINRLQKIEIEKSKKGILLLGPRQVGKSTLVKGLQPDLQINFSDERTLIDYAGQPSSLPDLLERTGARSIFIDEVQRLPSILNTVQALIDSDKKLKFYLTGSSARKLKRGGANLLPGRVINYSLGPVVARELDYKFDIRRTLQYGFLPEILSLSKEAEKKEILLSYSSNYIREEVQAEALVRSLESFTRFLNELCKWTGSFIDYTKLSKRAQISRHTCPNYLEILEDTMIGHRLFPDPDLIERADLVKHPKFFFFDVGVFNALDRSFEVSNRRIGALMEQLVFQQIFHSSNALRKNFEIHSFRTRGGLEVDFALRIDGHHFLVEAKAAEEVQDNDFAALALIRKQYLPDAKAFIFHSGPKARKYQTIWALPVAEGLREIGL